MTRRFLQSGIAAALTTAFVLPVAARLSADTLPSPVAIAGVYDVRAFGAKGDGMALDSPAIDAAISAASAAGGGTVRFPAGSYLSLSIHLRSHVALYLDSGASIVAAPASKDTAYDDPEPNPDAKAYQDFGHTHFHNSLIWGENLNNVAILGTGRIYGKGLSSSNTEKSTYEGNKSISLKNCRNVVLKDFTIQHGGWFGILATGVDNLTIDNLKIDTNRDGMDIDCCRNVRIANCSVNSPHDDGICLKSSYGLGTLRSTENVTITGCQVSGYDEGSFLDGTFKRGVKNSTRNGPTGRIKLGTESNGGFKNIAISGCVFDYCRGLALETVDGALLEDVSINNITMRDIINAPIFLRLGARMRGPEGTPVGALRRVSISDVTCWNADPHSGCLLTGIPGHDIEDVTLRNIRIYYAGGGTREDATQTPPELEKGYPEPSYFGAIPAYGFFVRHAKNVTMDGIQVRVAKEDARPAFMLTDVESADLQNIKAQRTAGTPAFVLKNVADASFVRCTGVPDTHIEKADDRDL